MNNATPAVGPDTAISPEVVKHVKAVAASMIGHAAFQKCDFDDICQDLFQQIILATPKFDPAKSSFDTYACQIADRYKNRIYRERIYEKRDVPTIPFTFNEETQNVYEEEPAVNDIDRQNLIDDVWIVVNQLPPREKKFCIYIMHGDSLREAAVTAGYAWGTSFYKRIVLKLKRKFQNAGF